MFEKFKKLFKNNDSNTDLTGSDSKFHKNDEDDSEHIDEVDAGDIGENIEVFPESNLSLEAPIDQQVLDLAKLLKKKSKSGDGLLIRNEDYLHYYKDYEFCNLNWIIIDSSIEKKEGLKKAFNHASRKWNSGDPRKTTSRNFAWYIDRQLLVNQLRYTSKEKASLSFAAKISKWTQTSFRPKEEFVSTYKGIDLFDFKFPTEGYFSLIEELNRFRSYAICIIFFEKKEVLLEHRFCNYPIVKKDPFNNKVVLEWKSIGGPSSKYHNLIGEQTGKRFDSRSYITLNNWLFFKLKNDNGLDYISFEFDIREIKLKTGDSIFFLLSNESVIEFELHKKFHTIEPRVIKGVDVPLNQEELRSLSKHEIEKIRVHEKKNNFKVDIGISDFIHQWDMYKEYRQYVIRNLFANHLEQVENMIDDYKPITGKRNVINDTSDDPCHVYLMKDLANGFYKIGISNEPAYREHTLQSEKPTIELIESKEFPSRKIADSFEKALHDAFDSKRLRGEWFELDESEVEEIKKSLS